MPIEAPYPELDELLEVIGEAGSRLSDIDASEGAAGNISVYLGWTIDPRRKFPIMEKIQLPIVVPELSGKSLIITGSGRRLRDIIQDPAANLGFLQIEQGGTSGLLYKSTRCLFTRLTSELNSHLAIHKDQVTLTGTNFHAVIHAQPPNLTYLSHIPRYQDEQFFNKRILRWQPELIVHLPEGVGDIPFAIPGSEELERRTLESLRIHRVVVWGKHGVMARSDASVKRACDRIEYAETGAKYEYMNLVAHELGEGLSLEEIRSICAAFNIKQNIF
ncbi:MAG: class II aldolase/adducin family protein [Chloroflexota bacterium]